MIEPPTSADGTIRLTPEQTQMLREAEADFESGEGYTFEEVMEHARARVRTWPPSQSA